MSLTLAELVHSNFHVGESVPFLGRELTFIEVDIYINPPWKELSDKLKNWYHLKDRTEETWAEGMKSLRGVSVSYLDDLGCIQEKVLEGPTLRALLAQMKKRGELK